MIGVSVMTKIPKEWQDLDPILSAEEVAELLDVHVNTVKKWINSKQLPAFKQGRVIRIYRDEFFKFAEVGQEGKEGKGE